MKKNLLFLLFVSIFAISANAQVTIGSQDAPTAGAILELKSTELGFLPPRVPLTKLSQAAPLPAHVEGMVVYNTTVSLPDTLQVGLYYNNGHRWVRLSTTSSFTENWFYMPSIVFDTSTQTPADQTLTMDLYAKFKEQLNDVTNTNTGTNLVKNSSAPTKVLSTIPAATDLNYYITAYDPAVFQIISISDSGVLTYRVLATATDETILNIVFVEK